MGIPDRLGIFKQRYFWSLLALTLCLLTATISFQVIIIWPVVILWSLLWAVLLAYLYPRKLLFFGFNVLFIFLLYLIADTINYGRIPSKYTFYYGYFSVFMLGALVIARQTLPVLLAAPAIVGLNLLFFLIPSFYIVYYINFGTYVTSDILDSIFQTNVFEAYEAIPAMGVNSMDTSGPLFAGHLILHPRVAYEKSEDRD